MLANIIVFFFYQELPIVMIGVAKFPFLPLSLPIFTFFNYAVVRHVNEKNTNSGYNR